MVINMNIKKVFLSAIVICCLLWCYPVNANEEIEHDNLSNLNDIVLKLLVPQIQTTVDDFYSPYLTTSPIVVYYMAKIVEIKNNELSIEVFPYVGAHNSVGKDRITFDISNAGQVTLKSFIHIKSYALPPHLQSRIKKPLP